MMDWKEKYLFPLVGPLARIYLNTLSRARLPQVSGLVRLKGLRGPVEILRDRWYVPHIYTARTEDAVFAQGYVHAQERLWQMDFNRRVISGRLAEIVGQPGLGADRAMRAVGLRRVAEQEAQTCPDPVCSVLQAYCAGANAWIETAIRGRKLPVEFTLLGYEPEPWQPVDIFGWAKLMSWVLAGNWNSEFLRGQIIQRLGKEKAETLELNTAKTWAAVLDAARPGTDPTRPFTGAQAGEGVGSNNWVIAGSRTASGKPLLANDMHLDLTAPAIWFENHLASDTLDVTGVSLPGAPLVISGHNRYVAWGFTDGFTDAQDLYEEHLRTAPGGGMEYEFAGQWYPAEVRKEEIRVKGAAPVTQEVVSTRHGPIINVLFDQVYPDVSPLAMRWTALEPETTFQAIYEGNHARNCAEFHQALRLFSGPAQNVVYADTQGNIGYTLNGRVPIRARGDGTVPVPGWTGDYEWTGYLPFEEQPHLENPARGFVATANNPHDREGSLPFIGRDYCSPDRAARITELIEVRPKIDVPYIQKMHYDEVSVSARVMAKYLGGLAVEDPDLRELTQQMQTWDGNLRADSRMAAVFEVTIRQALRLVLEHHLGEPGLHALGKAAAPVAGLWNQHAWDWFIQLLDEPESLWFDLGHGEGRDDVLRLALRAGVDYLRQALGPDQSRWTWGRLNQLTFRHVLGGQKPLDAAFNLGPIPMGGDATTIKAAAMNQYYDWKPGSLVGPPFRFIADLGDSANGVGEITAWAMLAPGQSGNPASPHYRDGIRPWLEGDYHPMLFKRSEVEQSAQARLELAPEE